MKFFSKLFFNKRVFKEKTKQNKNFIYNLTLVSCKVLLLVSALKIELLVKFPLSWRWKINEPLTSDILKLMQVY